MHCCQNLFLEQFMAQNLFTSLQASEFDAIVKEVMSNVTGAHSRRNSFRPSNQSQPPWNIMSGAHGRSAPISRS